MGFINSNIGRLMGSTSTSTALSGAQALLAGETDGLAFDFTDSSAYIIDTGTPANNYSSTGIVSSGSLVGPSGKLTYTSPSNKLTRQSDGYIKYQAHNLITYSEQFDNAAWINGPSGTASAPVVTANHGTAPNGAATADRIVLDLNGGTSTGDICLLRNSVTVVGGVSYVADVWLKSSDGLSTYTVQIINADGLATSCAVTGTWTKFTTGAVAATGSGGLNFGIRIRGGQTPTNSDVADLHVWGYHVYIYPANTDYIATSSAAVYALPIEYDTSGNCLGLLVEEARTNVFTNGATFGATWNKLRSTIALNATGPDGVANSAATLSDDSSTGTNTSFVSFNPTVSTSTTYTCSVYAKADQLSWLGMGTANFTTPADGTTYFDLSGGSVGTTAAGHTARISDAGNGWYRCSITFTTDASDTTGGLQFYLADADTDNTVDLDGTSSILLWGPQLEAGAFPTSPILTYGATATRAADNISIATSAFPYSSTAHCIAAKFDASPDLSGNPSILTVREDSSNYTRIYWQGAGPARTYVNGAENTSATSAALTDFTNETGSSGIRLGGAFAQNSVLASKNGVTMGTEDTTWDQAQVVATIVYVGEFSGSGSSSPNTTISKIIFVPGAKSQTELNDLTGSM